MPARSDPRVQRLVQQFVQLYDSGRWGSAVLSWPDEQVDGEVDALADIDGGPALAIEHTLIEPFEGNQEELRRLERFFQPLEHEPSLRVPGVASYVFVSREGLARGISNAESATALRAWLLANLVTLPVDNKSRPYTYEVCGGTCGIAVRRVALGGGAAFLLIRRFGAQSVPEMVSEALRRKLGKLAGAKAARRVLMLERQDWGIDERQIIDEVYRTEDDLVEQDRIEVWIAETTFTQAEEYVDFKKYDRAGRIRRSFSFYNGEPLDASEDGIPCVLRERELP